SIKCQTLFHLHSSFSMTRNPKNNSSTKRVAQDFETDSICIFPTRTLQRLNKVPDAFSLALEFLHDT
ncbi:MAG: hypothetical protein LBT53_03360, partial [Puniceicoccales bacterium]|nr:hypothetical protein [Puniceicoccales bacterium]